MADQEEDPYSSISIDRNGLISSASTPQQSSDDNVEQFEINYAQTMDLDEFINVENKRFTLKEIENLLSSTSHYHKLYALRILKAVF